jgi:putative transposase
VTFVETHRHTFGGCAASRRDRRTVSTFYDRTSRTPSATAVADAAVAERIEAVWERSRRIYGAPRIHTMLAREGIRVGRQRVERLMRQLRIQGAHQAQTLENHPTGQAGHRGTRLGGASLQRRRAEQAVGWRT